MKSKLLSRSETCQPLREHNIWGFRLWCVWISLLNKPIKAEWIVVELVLKSKLPHDGWVFAAAITSPKSCRNKIKSPSNPAQTHSSLACSWDRLLWWTNAVSVTATETLTKKGLTIGGHESSWLADLAGACILDNTKSRFRKTKWCSLHRDDGTAAFKNKLSCNDMLKWRTTFQNSMNRPAGGNHMQFTCGMWLDKSRTEMTTEQNDPKTSIETGCFFPCLDTEFVMATNTNLLFRAHLKPNQQLKHLEADNIHTKSCFKAILSGVCKRPCWQQLREQTRPCHQTKSANKTSKLHTMQEWSPKRSQHWLNNCNTMKKLKLLNKPNPIRTMNATGGTCFCIGHSNIWSKPVHSVIRAVKENSIFNGWECLCLTTDLPTLEKSFKETCLRNSLSGQPHKTLNRCPATAERAETVFAAKTTCTGIQQQPAKSNATTQGRCARETHNKSSKSECNNISMKSKRLSNLVRNQIHAPNILQLNSVKSFHPQSTNVEEWPAASSDKATPSACSKLLLPNAAPFVPKSELQLSNNLDPTHNFLSTPTTKSAVPADTDHAKWACEADHPQRWWVNQWRKSQPNTQSCHRFFWVQHLPSWCATGSNVRTNKKKLFSICFQSTSPRNNSNNLLQISHSLLFSMILFLPLEEIENNLKQISNHTGCRWHVCTWWGNICYTGSSRITLSASAAWLLIRSKETKWGTSWQLHSQVPYRFPSTPGREFVLRFLNWATTVDNNNKLVAKTFKTVNIMLLASMGRKVMNDMSQSDKISGKLLALFCYGSKLRLQGSLDFLFEETFQTAFPTFLFPQGMPPLHLRKRIGHTQLWVRKHICLPSCSFLRNHDFIFGFGLRLRLGYFQIKSFRVPLIDTFNLLS